MSPKYIIMVKSDKYIAEQYSKDTNRGYWSVNDTDCFFRKYEALRHASQLKTRDIKYHYFDEFYKRLDWYNEPRESLEELYKQRAMHLRDRYDYIILSFSGGSDSSNVLESFVKNRIHIDEVITAYPKLLVEKLLPKFDTSDKFHGNSPFEYYTAALPRLKRLSHENPEIKITDLDITLPALDSVMTGNLINLTHSGWPPTIPIVGTYHTMYKRVRELHDKGLNVCWLNGCDKPRLGYSPGKQKFAFYFDDISFTHGEITEDALSGFKPTTESFYFTQEIPQITLKQCALIKKALNPIFINQDSKFIRDNNLISRTTISGNFIINVHSDFIKKIIYPDWNTNIFQAEKPPNQGQGDGTGYYYYNSGLLDQRILDYAVGQIRDWYDSINPDLLFLDKLGRPQEHMYQTQPITLKFS
jgi:hypothetical protein